MDPNLTPASQPPKDLKTQMVDSSQEFVKNNYEGFLRRLVGVIYSLLKFLKESLVSIIGQFLGKD